MLYVNAHVKLNTYSVINSNIELRLVSIYREIIKKKERDRFAKFACLI